MCKRCASGCLYLTTEHVKHRACSGLIYLICIALWGMAWSRQYVIYFSDAAAGAAATTVQFAASKGFDAAVYLRGST